MKIAIYQTSDLHGYVYPTNYVESKEQGLLKIGSYIINDEKNYDASLKVDCGDLLQGSPFTYYLSKIDNLTHNPIIDGMQKIGYDAYIFGNHDFNYGQTYMTNSYKNVEDHICCANIEGVDLDYKPYRIYNFDGFKIAVFGITTSYIPNWENKSNIENINFLDPVEMYAKYEKEMLENSDYIIVAYHGGFECSLTDYNQPTEKQTKENQGSELLRKFKSIDLMLSGHQHRSFIEVCDNRVCTQPINNGVNFSKVVLDTKTKQVSYELLSVADLNIEINPELESLFTSYAIALEQFLDQQVGTLSEDILCDDLFEVRLKGHAFVNLLQEIQMSVSDADFSTMPVFDTTIGFKQSVSIRDILINYPYPNTLKVLKVNGHKFKEALEKSASYFNFDGDSVKVSDAFTIPKKQNYNYDLYYGLEYEYDLSKPIGERVTKMKKDGKDLDLDQDYLIVMNNYRATNTSVYKAYEDCEVVKEINIDMSELMMDYFKNNPDIKVNHNTNFKIKY